MPVEVALIIEPAIDFTTLLGITHEALRRNIASAADASHRRLSLSEKYLTCLASLRNEETTSISNSLSHVSFGVLVIADDRSLLDILQQTLGMSFVQAETVAPGMNMAVLTGTLEQWRDAVAAGTDRTASPAVRTCYSKILLLFDHAGLTAIWSDYDRSTLPNRSGFLLEPRRV